MAKLGEYGDKLPTMTAQEVFNVGATHLMEQGIASIRVREGICAYNGNGVCCAAAPFIKDYNQKMEGKSWIDLVTTFGKSPNCKELIQRLQDIHDQDSPDQWTEQLTILASEYNLELPEVLK